MENIEERIARAYTNGDVKKLVEALRRSRGKGLTHRQLVNRKVKDVPAAYYGALENSFPVYTEKEVDNGRSILRYLIGAE